MKEYPKWELLQWCPKLKKKADKAKADAELQKKIDKGIKDSGMGDKGTAITQKGREQAAYNRGERAARKKLNDPTLNALQRS